jgi:hypothetical protein
MLVLFVALLGRCDSSPLLLVAPRQPKIVLGPPASTTGKTASFSYSDVDPHVGFRCALDSAPLAPCSVQGIWYGSLHKGSHVFSVAAQRGHLLSARSLWKWSVLVRPAEKHAVTDLTGPAAASSPLQASAGHFDITGKVGQFLSPGHGAPVDLTFTNHSSEPIAITSVDITIRDSTTRRGIENYDCLGSKNLAVLRTMAASPLIPAHTTVSLRELHVPESEWPIVFMPNLPTNQDACKDTTFFLDFSGEATAR